MLNEALRLVRVYHDLTQSELSRDLQISNSYLSEIEAGKKQPTLDVLAKYSERFDVPVSSLLFFSEKLSENGAIDRVRQVTAKKVLSLLKWVEEKNDKGSSRSAKQKAA